MFANRFSVIAILTVMIMASGFQIALAKDIKVTIPKRSHLTPVQRLNREGVDAVEKHNYEKAETLFYQAYLFDPADPFTLYNLGYVSELKGQLERAQKLYGLASEQATDAVIDRTSARQLEGKSMRDAFGGLKDAPLQVNRMNVEAIRLISQGRAQEALVVLQKALTIDPQNTYTLNNLGVAKEARGDYDEAMKYYMAAANSHSTEPVIVTLNRAWRGKPISEMAADSAKKLSERLRNAATAQAQAALLTVQGVSATNHNDWPTARQDFMKAYSLNPYSAFSLNNIGYLAERDGDLETAEFFYERARQAEDARAKVGLATRQSAEGMRIFAVASDSDQKVDDKITAENAVRRQHPGPVELKHRDNTPVIEPPPQPSPAPGPASQAPGSRPPQ
ncbi:MAG TPA: tetratricopeptide repeat protein [Terriglobales bacterium]|nr:tetratricopeptide repeat protein [Terriglobales bacterium]